MPPTGNREQGTGNGRRKDLCFALALCMLAAGCWGGVTPPPPAAGWVPGTLRIGQASGDCRSSGIKDAKLGGIVLIRLVTRGTPVM